MQHTITDTTVELTVTFRELVDMESCGWSIYATPTPAGLANQVYIASQPRFRDDFLLATTQDFDDEAGYDIVGGWQEMEQDEIDAQAEEQYTCSVPRRRQANDTR